METTTVTTELVRLIETRIKFQALINDLVIILKKYQFKSKKYKTFTPK